MRKILTTLVVTSVLIVGITTSAKVYEVKSAASQTVYVVRDVTSSRCTIRNTSLVGTPNESTVSIPCPSGTALKPEATTLANAQSQHLPYLLLPTTQQDKDNFSQKLISLENQVRHSLSPTYFGPMMADCSGSNASYLDWWSGSYYIDFEVDYSYSNCSSIQVGTAYITTYGAVEWSEEDYAAGLWPICDFWSSGPSSGSFNPGSNSHNQGYYAVEYVNPNNDSACYNPHQWPSLTHLTNLDLGPFYA